MKVVALAGGVGGAKLCDGLYKLLKPEELTVIVNTGDDFQHFGLNISPDLDTVCYNIAGIENPITGWGRNNDTFKVMNGIMELDGPGWFKLGDNDLSIHLERTRLLHDGFTLSSITKRISAKLDIKCLILPMSDNPVKTQICSTNNYNYTFQEYFVLHQCKPVIKEIHYLGSDKATPAPNVLEKIETSDMVIICPSNPWLSICPILSINGIMNSIKKKKVLAVSPLIGGEGVKGPIAKIYKEFGIQPKNLSIARHYIEFLSVLVIDPGDFGDAGEIKKIGIKTFTTNTRMSTREDRNRLAREILKFASE